MTNESLKKEIHTMDMLSNGTIDGFILSISEETQKDQEFKHFKETISEGVPIVMFDRISDEVNCDKVIVDDFDSSVSAVNHLIRLNCKKIALVSSIDNLSVGKLRAQGYVEALNDNDLPINKDLIIRTDNPDEFDFKMQELLDNQTVDAIFALDEHTSTMAMKLAIKKGMKIPEELQVIGFADGVWSRRMTPSLTTISQHGVELGEEAARLLIEKLESKEEEYTYTTTVIKTELRQRDSTRKL